jgi:hypothetical protein
MSLDIYLTVVRPTEVFETNITHNLSAMAAEAGIYQHLWRPEEIGIATAGQLIDPLRSAIALMEAEPERFKAHNPSNGWGSYEFFIPWLKELLVACEQNPDATIKVSR